MLISSASFSAVAVAMVGLLVFWSNPSRSINRLFFTFSLHLTAWLICVHIGISQDEDPFWVRMSSSVAAFVPLHMWLLKRVYVNPGAAPLAADAMALLRWTVPALVLTALCWTNWYVLPRPIGASDAPHFGAGYFVYMIGEFTLFGLLCRETIVQLRRLTGVSRLELQILLLGVTAAAFAIILLMALRVALHAFWPIHLQPLMLLIVYTATLVAVTTHRIFDARQIAIVVLQKAVLVVTATATAYVSERVLGLMNVPEPFPLLIAVGITLWFVSLLNRVLQSRLHFYPEATAARQAAFVATQRETRSEQLETAFRGILKGWGQSEMALLVSGPKSSLSGEGAEPAETGFIVRAMETLRWATPERLARERPTRGRERVAQYMKQKGLGVLVISEGPTLAALIGVGASATRLPYTYPQVMQLLELASIMEGALERVHFSTKAQHAEQLATVGLLGASLAHEIRNPLVTIKTFVQLLPAHYQDASFREKFFRLIGDEVDRIDRLTEQLLDLASPRTYSAAMVELHPVLRATIDLAATKAAHKNVQLVADFAANPDTVHTDAAAAKQVMLNLCFNAIQALDGKEDGPRCVWVGTRNTEGGVEVAVADSGPGIAPEILPRLFQPFQTTKSSGFGLGLAICSDILANLNASITVDQPVPGQGATFRVIFPCRPSSS